MQQLPCSSHLKKETENMREQRTKAQVKKWTIISYPSLVPPPRTWYKSTTPCLFHPSIIYDNNAIDIEFLLQTRQSGKCGSVRNDEKLNLHLGSGAGPCQHPLADSCKTPATFIDSIPMNN